MSRITLKTLADAAPKNKKILFEKKTIAAFEEIIDPDILAAVSKLEENEQQELLELAQKTLSGKTTAKEFLDKIGDLVGNIYHRNI